MGLDSIFVEKDQQTKQKIHTCCFVIAAVNSDRSRVIALRSTARSDAIAWRSSRRASFAVA